MARDGYLILDSDLHMMEPDDLWACYLEGPHRASPPRFFGGQQQRLSDSSEDKGNADRIMGMEVKRQCYIALDVDEEPAVDVVNKMGADYFVVSTDYSHSDGAFPEAMEQFLGLPFSHDVRRKILWNNCARLYDIDTPAAALTQDASRHP